MAVIVCPICSTRYRVTDAQLSKASRLKCKKCKTVFPVSDNIRDEGAGSQDAATEFGTQSVSDAPNLAGSAVPPAAQPDADDMTLDFNFSAAHRPTEPAPSLDFSFSAATPETPEDETDQNVEIEDHIADALHNGQGHLDVGLGGFSLSGGADDGESTLSMDGSGLDFSFSAVAPDMPPDTGAEDGVFAEGPEGDGSDVPGGGAQDVSLGLDFDALPHDATMTMSDIASSPPAGALNLDISLTEGFDDAASGGGHVEAGKVGDGAAESLATCCSDSLAMGMTTCELCGRNLQGVDSQKFIKQRREELRGELPEGEAHIGFSADGGQAAPLIGMTSDDFSDVERALDALADGSFEKQIKKREAQKYRGKRLKLIGAGVVFGVILIIGVGVMLLPSGHARLVGRYEELMAKPAVDPKNLVTLFLDAAAAQDHDIVQRISVMSAMPDISGGSVVTLGEDYEQTSLGQLGKDVADLEAQLSELNAAYQHTEKQWKEATAVDLSPAMLNSSIEQLVNKQTALHAEFDGKEQDSLQRTNSLQAEIRDAEADLALNRQRAQQYLDATDPHGKAMYTASVRNQQSLSDKIGKLNDLLTSERLSHANRMRASEAEYAPQFAKIADDLAVQRALYDKAVLYADSEKSPLIVLDLELKALKSAMNDVEHTLKDKQQQLATALDFFKRPERRAQVEQHRPEAEFMHVSKNVVASIKFRGADKRQVPIVLKRYQAVIGDQTIQGDWVVEAILR